jgi:signal transduction histidine kinase
VSTASDEKPHLDVESERKQTDESLRAEREKVDLALLVDLRPVDETADAVIVRARILADALLAATRARTDQQPANGILGQESVRARRAHEDDVLRAERSAADEATREERAEHVALLATERRETDKDLLIERARADAALATRDEFLGIVSHDLRNILNLMVGYASLITTDVSQPDHVDIVQKHADRIRRSGARMNRLIGDLVDVASIHAGALTVTCEPGDPAHVVAEIVDTFEAQAKAAGLQLAREVPPGLPRASFDPARLLQVLTNLIGNAIKFTPAGGKILVRLAVDGDSLRFSVQDTGVGIAADKLEQVFDRFLQLSDDRRGVGLGLYISKCIVHGHGGRIWVESTPARGSTFSFTLPLGSAGPPVLLGHASGAAPQESPGSGP